MATAARLAKAGHPVELFERRPVLGGRWRPVEVPGVGIVDAAPAVLGFPAPWRDLFRKSGRPLEAELARSGHALVPAAGARYRFADGAELTLPTERAEQHAVLGAAYGPAVAGRWQGLLDELDDVWQTLRPLGLEAELAHRSQLPRPVRARLRSRQSLARLAAGLREPHLEALVRSVAHRYGSTPERTPAWVAVELSVARRFSRWQVVPRDAQRHPADTGRSSVLAEALGARLALRRVEVHRERPVLGLLVEGGRVAGVRTADAERVPAAAVVVTTDPWQLVDLLPAGADRPLACGVRRTHPAAAPALSHTHSAQPCEQVSETVELSGDGVPVVSYRRPAGEGTIVSRHDHGHSQPDPGSGVAWRGFGSWLRRPPVVTSVTGLYTAGPSSRAGNGPSATILSAALAAAACHDRHR